MVEYTINPATGTVDSFASQRMTGERMTAAHAPYLKRLAQVPDVMEHVGGVRTADESATWLDAQLDHWTTHGFGQWMLRDRKGDLIGRGGLRMIDECVGEDLVEIGYILNTPAWGRGYATEAAAAFVCIASEHHAFEQLGAITRKGNDASTRVLEKCGFVFERWVDHVKGPHKFLRLKVA